LRIFLKIGVLGYFQPGSYRAILTRIAEKWLFLAKYRFFG